MSGQWGSAVWVSVSFQSFALRMFVPSCLCHPVCRPVCQKGHFFCPTCPVMVQGNPVNSMCRCMLSMHPCWCGSLQKVQGDRAVIFHCFDCFSYRFTHSITVHPGLHRPILLGISPFVQAVGAYVWFMVMITISVCLFYWRLGSSSLK